jgi:hypothetical protein
VIRLKPTDETQREIDALTRQIERLAALPEDALRPTQEAIRASFAANFASESAGAASWAPLAPRTVRDRERLGYPGEHPILVRSGSYRRSFIDPADDEHYSRVTHEAGRTVIAEGTTDIRAGTLEFGSDRVPARPALIAGDAARQRITDALDRLFATWLEREE